MGAFSNPPLKPVKLFKNYGCMGLMPCRSFMFTAAQLNMHAPLGFLLVRLKSFDSRLSDFQDVQSEELPLFSQADCRHLGYFRQDR
jgi:hypothetical protein